MASAYLKFWQIFGKMDFDDNSPDEGKVSITAYLLVISMVGMGGLEPPTSPLSGAEVTEDRAMTQKSAGRAVNGIEGPSVTIAHRSARLGANLKHHT